VGFVEHGDRTRDRNEYQPNRWRALSATNGGTQVQLVHSKFDKQGSVDQHSSDWDNYMEWFVKFLENQGRKPGDKNQGQFTYMNTSFAYGTFYPYK
jgi:hypothetical protein